MNYKTLLCLALILSTGLLGAPLTAQPSSPVDLIMVDKDLTKQIADILKLCQKVKPGTTYAELLKTFTTEGGISNSKQQTFVYRGCPYIKIDVEFTLSDPKQNTAEGGPIVSKVSKPYLAWSVMD
jgi:hypothetical protein